MIICIIIILLLSFIFHSCGSSELLHVCERNYWRISFQCCTLGILCHFAIGMFLFLQLTWRNFKYSLWRYLACSRLQDSNVQRSWSEIDTKNAGWTGEWESVSSFPAAAHPIFPIPCFRDIHLRAWHRQVNTVGSKWPCSCMCKMCVNE